MEIFDKLMNALGITQRDSRLDFKDEVSVWAPVLLTEMLRAGRFFFLIERHGRIRAIRAPGS
jgi:hypothetical protein